MPIVPRLVRDPRLGFAALVAGAVVVALGLALGGYLAGRGVLASRLDDRFVTVKGVAELETVADLATYPIRFTVTAGELAEAKRRIDEQTGQVVAFLKEQGLAADELSVQRLELQDLLAQAYRPEGATGENRFIMSQTVAVRSPRVELVTQVSEAIGELVGRGIVLSDSAGPTYVFTADRLNEVKPDLIRRATEAARVAAEEFARAAGSRVGDIRRANQGVIVVLARDESPMSAEWQSVAKRVRAVTTVEYYLAR